MAELDQDDALHQQQPADDKVMDVRPRKRAVKTINDAPAKRRSKKPNLSKLTEMPLDVVFEILSNLHPADLLSVARSTKIFRELLMKRSSKTIWKAARQNVDPPEFPESPSIMSEPAYASLMFTANCTFCGKGGTQNIEWEMIVRCCKACRENPKLFLDMHPRGPGEENEELWIQEYLPSITKGRDVYVRVSEADVLMQKMKDCINQGGDLEQVLASQLSAYKHLINQAKPCKAWDDKRAYNKMLERTELRDQRRAAVWAKLAEVGLAEEEHQMDPWWERRLAQMDGMKETVPLTDRAWDKIKDNIIAVVQNSRRARVRNARCAPYNGVIEAFTVHLDAYARTQPLNECFPSTLEFCMTPRIRPMVEELVQNGVNALDVAHFTELIAQICHDFKNGLDARVAKLLPPWLHHESGVSASLASALVWFYCPHTDSPVDFKPCQRTTIAYPRILTHRHLYSSHRSCLDPQTTDDDLMNAIDDHYMMRPSMLSLDLLNDVSFDLHASFVAAQIVSLCGLHPASTSSADMDLLDARIVCVPCRSAMSWRKAVSHAFNSDHEGAREWILLNTADTKALKKIEAKYKPKTTTGEFHCYRCRHFDRDPQCSWSYKGTKTLKNHLERKHGVIVRRLKLDVDYYHDEGEPTSDKERPHAVRRCNFDFTISTPALVDKGW